MDRKNTGITLKNSIKFIRFRIGDELVLRHVPSIEFVFDESIERAQRVLSLIDKISSDRENSGK